MKIVGHPISFRLPGRVSELRNRLSRARYFRGHGVHSPFVYDIVRSVFMRDDLLPGRRDLYEALLTAGVSRRRAVQLQNLMIHCGYTTFGLNRADAEFCVATCGLPRPATLALVRAAAYKKRVEIQNQDTTEAGLDAVKSLVWQAMAKERPDLYRQVNEFLNSKRQDGLEAR